MVFYPNTPLSTPFSNTLSLRCSLDMSSQLPALVHTVLNFRAPLRAVALCLGVDCLLLENDGVGDHDTWW